LKFNALIPRSFDRLRLVWCQCSLLLGFAWSLTPKIPAAVCRRLARCYGSRAEALPGEDGLGREIVNGLFKAELH
jgi:hypothetical protein